MKQVQVWIAVCQFTDEVFWRINCDIENEILEGQVDKVIENKCNHFVSMDEHSYLVKPEETIETIIQALWKYQKSLLPDNFETKSNRLIMFYEIHNPKERKNYQFYNPETGIITVCSFD